MLLTFSLCGLLYIFYPLIFYAISFHENKTVPYATQLMKRSDIRSENREVPKENHLVIPKINVDVEIVEGANEQSLFLGAWHYPGSAIPGEM